MVVPSLLAIRTDAGPETGVGHLARCLALAQAWNDAGGCTVLLSDDLPTEWVERIAREGIEVRAPRSAADLGAAWVVLDGYQFGPTDQRHARAWGERLLVIDDGATAATYSADLIVDSNPDAPLASYQRGDQAGATLLLGSRYLLLRREFASAGASEAVRETGAPRRLLVAWGGAPTDETRATLDQVLGDERLRSCSVTVLEGADEVRSLMARSDIALSASGSTAWELCAVGVPAVLFAVADNQTPVGTALARRGAASFVGLLSSTTPHDVATSLSELMADAPSRATMAQQARRLVDGLGARRVVAEMRAARLVLRSAGQADRRRTWEWSNDETARAMALSTDPIPWSDHERWFDDTLRRSDRHLWIAELDGEALGQVRFDVQGDAVEISLVVGRGHRGQGWGAPLILAGVRRVFTQQIATTVDARVRDDNTASVRSFDLAGFERRANSDPSSRWHEYRRSDPRARGGSS